MNFDQAETKHIILPHNRMYWHKIIRFNYTTYDMQREQDVLNPGTSHCNFMALAPLNSGEISNEHPFMYGRALGIFHVNVIYNGPGMIDYQPRRFDFLWVRWYDLEPPPPSIRGQHPNLGHALIALTGLSFRL
jgi:hypothetical protein